jgi:hypothetical protein
MAASNGNSQEYQPPSRAEVEKAATDFQNEIAAAFDAYMGMYVLRRTVDCTEQAEVLAERWRIPIERYQLEQVGDEFISDEGAQLYSAIEASFILTLSADPARRALRLDPDELMGRILGAGEGIWHEHWPEIHESILTEVDRKVAGPADLPAVTVKRPSRLSRFNRSRTREIDAWKVRLGEAYTEAAFFYKELAPDGRELSAAERAAAEEHVETAATVDRELDLTRELFSEQEWSQTRLMLAEFRSLRRSLTLALSSNPHRRSLALSLDEAGVRTFIMNQRVNGASHQDAIERLKVEMAAGA